MPLPRTCRQVAAKVVSARILALCRNGPLLVIATAKIGRRAQARMLGLGDVRLLCVGGLGGGIGFWHRRGLSSRRLLGIVVARRSVQRWISTLLWRISSRRGRLRVWLRLRVLPLGRARPGARILIG